MSYSERAVQKMEREVPAKAAKAVKAAYKEALNSGNTVLIVAHGTLYRVKPDLTRTAIRQMPKRIPIAKGSTFKIK